MASRYPRSVVEERYDDEDELDRLFPAAPVATEDDDLEPVTALARWRRTTTSGALMAAIGLGLREVFEPPREEAAIVLEAPGAPPGEQEIELHFDPDHPDRTRAVIRTWPDDDADDDD